MLSDPDDAIETELSLPPELRIEVAQQLVQSVAPTGSQPETPLLSDEQLAEIERRLKRLRDDPTTGLSHDDVWRRLRARHES